MGAGPCAGGDRNKCLPGNNGTITLREQTHAVEVGRGRAEPNHAVRSTTTHRPRPALARRLFISIQLSAPSHATKLATPQCLGLAPAGRAAEWRTATCNLTQANAPSPPLAPLSRPGPPAPPYNSTERSSIFQHLKSRESQSRNPKRIQPAARVSSIIIRRGIRPQIAVARRVLSIRLRRAPPRAPPSRNNKKRTGRVASRTLALAPSSVSSPVPRRIHSEGLGPARWPARSTTRHMHPQHTIPPRNTTPDCA